MTRSEKWSWVRHEAIVVGVVALAVCGLLRSGTVHFGPPPPDDAPYMHEYRGALTAWQLGYAGIGGWVENLTDRDCPSMLVWVESYELDDLSRQLGPMGVANGYVAVGPLHAHQRLVWAGQRIDPQRHLVPFATAPLPGPSFDCYR